MKQVGRKRGDYMWKEWMLKFYWEEMGEQETFYFGTKEAMEKFVRRTGVIVDATFHLEQITLDI